MAAGDARLSQLVAAGALAAKASRLSQLMAAGAIAAKAARLSQLMAAGTMAVAAARLFQLVAAGGGSSLSLLTSGGGGYGGIGNKFDHRPPGHSLQVESK